MCSLSCSTNVPERLSLHLPGWSTFSRIRTRFGRARVNFGEDVEIDAGSRRDLYNRLRDEIRSRNTEDSSKADPWATAFGPKSG